MGFELMTTNIIHEIGHIIDWHNAGAPNNGNFGTQDGFAEGWVRNAGGGWRYDGSMELMASNYIGDPPNPAEDYAETFVWLVNGTTTGRRTATGPSDNRITYVQDSIKGWLPPRNRVI
jgi:hypothetical protein